MAITVEELYRQAQQLSPEERRKLGAMLVAPTAEDRLRTLASACGLAWDDLNADTRELFIDNLLHEDRAYYDPWRADEPGAGKLL